MSLLPDYLTPALLLEADSGIEQGDESRDDSHLKAIVGERLSIKVESRPHDHCGRNRE